ncbi:MAG: molybdopterin-dependent oxidoreductase [Christensenellaceae bacterium]|jgi:CO/xanthine dehydrogenase Mo-binding subunit/aerobic-type carbon monoxide dehydrogenase small subunit (CoxS/CutS family)|nr:molybdopterin-dependent oxidoreductase [Christensenellaceae bacterium]
MQEFHFILNEDAVTVYAEPNWTMLRVLRDVLGLTGTKCGCSTGDCGACKIIFEGEAINACLVQVRKAEGARITSIEGVAEGAKLHRIQQAFIDSGAVQCGFCTPGMVIAAKALLDKNQNPTEDEIRTALDNNLCRCTGYVKIVDAIQNAARVLRGEDAVAAQQTSSVIPPTDAMLAARAANPMAGARLPIRDAAEKVTGQLRYCADISLPGQLMAKLLYSTVPHARIKSIDTSAAAALPGVKAIVDYRNTPNVRYNSSTEVFNKFLTERMFDDTVRYVGDRVAAVAAVDEATAAKAVSLIKVEYEPLPVNFDPEAALEEGAYPLHDAALCGLAGGNLIETVRQNAGDVEAGFAEASRTYEDCYTFKPIHHAAIETHACIANYAASGALTVYTSSQDSYGLRANLRRMFGLPMNRIHVNVPAVGGGFGGKIDMMFEHVATALSMQSGRPVKLVLNRREEICNTRSRHAMKIRVKTGVTLEGRITAQEYTLHCNAGAYATSSSAVIWALSGKVFKVHKNPNIRFTGYAVMTNLPVSGPMRGFGSPQVFFAQQRQLNRIARDLGMDLSEIERLNLIEPNSLDPRSQAPNGNVRVMDCFTKALELADYDNALQQQKDSQNERVRIGIGIGVSSHGNGMFGVMTDMTAMSIKLNEDGSLVFASGSHEMGNGSITLQTQLIGGVLGVDTERIACVQADTDATLYQLGDYSSRGAYVSGHAAIKAAEKMKALLQEVAGDLLQVNPADITLKENAAAALDGRSATLEEVAAHARHKQQRELAINETFTSQAVPTSYGAHIAKVAVDVQTGEVKLLDYVAVHDVGLALNPLSIEGQIEGAVMMGAGHALCEGICFDANGRVSNATFKTYRLIHAKEMPTRIQVALIEQGEPGGPYGAKSIGECSVTPSLAAIGNAVSNAINRELNDAPFTPERILAALNEALA